jgi:miniconductance mechanosensitive channel
MLHDQICDFLTERNVVSAQLVAMAVTVFAIVLLALIVYGLLRIIALRVIAALAARTPTQWDNILVRRRVFHNLAALAPGIIIHVLAGLWLDSSSVLSAGALMQSIAYVWLLFFGMLTVHSFLDALVDICNTLAFARQLPIRSFVQVVKILTVLVFFIVTISLLLGKSPALLISGMGAMTAVIMLVFKDPILGFVAGIQLSANKMLAVGDWLEMPKYHADGDVIEVTLTTVKVRNWDQTITTIPTYALIADSFRNWRGMTEAGGRRIKRSLYIDMASIRFLSDDDIQKLRKAQLLSTYMQEKIADIEKSNRQNGHYCGEEPSFLNGRRLTNVGTLRAYLLAYLKQHPGIHQGLTLMVRQLQPTDRGLPIEIYAFTSDTSWVAHEGVQSDIFDHIIAIVPEFGLRVFQIPSGTDLRTLANSAHEGQR